MTKDELKRNQPVVYRTLSQALKKNQLSHLYLFSGPREASKREMAMLLIQSLFCSSPDEDGFACQECEECLSVRDGKHPDFYHIFPGMPRFDNWNTKDIHKFFEGKEVSQKKKGDSIRKMDILRLQESLGISAMKGGWQAFLIDDADQTTREGANTFLKFLEEPREDILGILISDHVDQILPTVRSRCQQLSFRSLPRQKRTEILEKESIAYPDLFTFFSYSTEDILNLMKSGENKPDKGEEKNGLGEKNPPFSDAMGLIEAARSLVENEFQPSSLLHLQLNCFYPQSPFLEKRYLTLFFQSLWYFIHTMIPAGRKRALLEEKVLEAIDDLRRPFDPALTVDRLVILLFRIVQKQRI